MKRHKIPTKSESVPISISRPNWSYQSLENQQQMYSSPVLPEKTEFAVMLLVTVFLDALLASQPHSVGSGT